MIATFATIAAIVEEKTFIICKPHFSDSNDYIISQRLLKSGFPMIATIAESFSIAIAAIFAILGIRVETSL